MNLSAEKKARISKILLTSLLIIFIAVFVVSAVMLIAYFIKGNSESELYEQNENLNALSSLFAATDSTAPVPGSSTSDQPTDTDSPVTSATASGNNGDSTSAPTVTDPPAPQYSERFTAIREQILALQKVNPDIVGVISAPRLLNETYPLLLRRNDYTNSYYLRRAYDYSDAVSGSIFYDFRCEPNPQLNRNTIIYGHNMRNGTMFGNLPRCVNSETEFNRAEIIIATLDGIYTFKLFSVYRTTASVNYCRTSFANDAEFKAFYDELVGRSLYKSHASPLSRDMILTLSTCTNLATDGRYALHAVLTKVET